MTLSPPLARVRIVPAAPAPARLLAALHRLCFRGQSWHRPWTPEEMASLLALPTTRGWLALSGAQTPVGLLLVQSVPPEAEILTLGVRPGSCRRQGVAGYLLATAAADLAAAGVDTLMLEVAGPNAAALAFYQRAGFTVAGIRPGYYTETVGGDAPIDALVLRRGPQAGSPDRPPDTRSDDITRVEPRISE